MASLGKHGFVTVCAKIKEQHVGFFRAPAPVSNFSTSRPVVSNKLIASRMMMHAGTGGSGGGRRWRRRRRRRRRSWRAHGGS
jgi:hypothetical protein